MPSFELQEFFGPLAKVSWTFQLSDTTIGDEQGDGTYSRASYGFRMWEGEVTVKPLELDAVPQIRARLQALRQPDMTLRITEPNAHSQAPGQVIDAIGSDRREVTPDGGAWAVGDLFGCVAGTVRSLHEVYAVSGSVLTVQPPLPLAFTVNDVINRQRPEIDCVVRQATLPTYSADAARGVSFGWRQTFL